MLKVYRCILCGSFVYSSKFYGMIFAWCLGHFCGLSLSLVWCDNLHTQQAQKHRSLWNWARTGGTGDRERVTESDHTIQSHSNTHTTVETCHNMPQHATTYHNIPQHTTTYHRGPQCTTANRWAETATAWIAIAELDCSVRNNGNKSYLFHLFIALFHYTFITLYLSIGLSLIHL